MQTLLEFAPLIAFLIAYQLADIYVATTTLMIAMVALLGFDFARTRRIPPMHGISAGLVLLFGSATLLLHDERFIVWKPTVFFWALGVAFLGSMFVGERTLAERFMSAASPDAFARIAAPAWSKVNAAWVAFYAAMGGANLWVVFNLPQNVWVQFKVFGITLATLVFVVAQSIYLVRHQTPAPDEAA
jgi:intracellular septation protein